MPKKALTKETIKEMNKIYDSGENSEMLGKKFLVCSRTIRKYLINPRKRGH